MIDVKELTTEELKFLSSVLNGVYYQDDLEKLKLNVHIQLDEKLKEESKKYNERMTIDMLLEMNSINENEYNVLRQFQIYNMRDLKAFDFSPYKMEIPEYMIEDFKYLVKYLDFDNYEDDNKKSK